MFKGHLVREGRFFSDNHTIVKVQPGDVAYNSREENLIRDVCVSKIRKSKAHHIPRGTQTIKYPDLPGDKCGQLKFKTQLYKYPKCVPSKFPSYCNKDNSVSETMKRRYEQTVKELGQERVEIVAARSQIESIVGYHGTLNCDNAMQLLNATFNWSKIINRSKLPNMEVNCNNELSAKHMALSKYSSTRLTVPKPDVKVLKNSVRLQQNLKLLRNK